MLVVHDGQHLRRGPGQRGVGAGHHHETGGHRGRRQKTRETSRLEDIAGIGPRRRASLLKHFGGLAGLKEAGAEEISRVEGVSAALAARIYASLHGLESPASPAPESP